MRKAAHTPMPRSLCVVLATALLLLLPRLAFAAPQLERLDRGVVALNQPDGKVVISWRLLGTDPANVAFNLYRKSEAPPARSSVGDPTRTTSDARRPRVNFGGGSFDPSAPRKLTATPLIGATFFIDETANLATATTYFVRAVIAGQEQPASPGDSFTFPAGAPPLPYLSIPLQPPDGAQPGDASAADLDGDGAYDLVVKFEQRGRDNSQGGATGTTFLQAYKLDLAAAHGPTSRLLWTINLGRNIREGAHYTQFMVYDLDGDGRAEVVCKTADGTIDGAGKVIGDPAANWVQPDGATAKVIMATRDGARTLRTVSTTGHILSGPEYLTVFDGLSGAALATTDYQPARVAGTTEFKPQELHDTWGDANGNRADRYLACVAYLDGSRPSVVFCRGYYTRTTLAAWDWRDGQLKRRWLFDSDQLAPPDRQNPYRGQGNHNLAPADVDGDGRDEIVYGAMVVDDNGQPLYSTTWGHGDALHVSDLVPENPGLEVFSIQERFDAQGMNLRDVGSPGTELEFAL